MQQTAAIVGKDKFSAYSQFFKNTEIKRMVGWMPSHSSGERTIQKTALGKFHTDFSPQPKIYLFSVYYNVLRVKREKCVKKVFIKVKP